MLSAFRYQRNQAANIILSYLYQATYRMCAEYQSHWTDFILLSYFTVLTQSAFS